MLLFVIELRPTCNVTGEMGAWQESHGRHKARACAPDRGHGDGCFQEYDNILINVICIKIAPYHFGPSNREFQSDDLTGFGSATHFDS